MNSGSPHPSFSAVGLTPPLDEQDLRVIANVEESLDRALQLREWWTAKNTTQSFAQRFNLIRSFNRPSSATGFFDVAHLRGISVPVMGVMQEMLYDRPDTGALSILPVIRNELREFVTQYFLRISDFRQPEAAIEPNTPAQVQNHGLLSWCSETAPTWEGFGYSQLYYKNRHSGTIGKFAEELRYEVVNLHTLTTHFEWIVLKVRIL